MCNQGAINHLDCVLGCELQTMVACTLSFNEPSHCKLSMHAALGHSQVTLLPKGNPGICKCWTVVYLQVFNHGLTHSALCVTEMCDTNTLAVCSSNAREVGILSLLPAHCKSAYRF